MHKSLLERLPQAATEERWVGLQYLLFAEVGRIAIFTVYIIVELYVTVSPTPISQTP